MSRGLPIRDTNYVPAVHTHLIRTGRETVCGEVTGRKSRNYERVTCPGCLTPPSEGTKSVYEDGEGNE